MRALGGPSTVGCVFLALSCTPLPPVHRAGSISMMPKGDGKQRRPKKSDLPPPPPEAAAPPPAPASRVESDKLISVRKQIALIKRFEAYQKQASSSPKSRTSFRKKEKGDAKTGRGDDEQVDVSGVDWNQLDVMFVDGYNIINAWPRLKKPFVKGDLATARRLLLDDVADFTVKRYESVVVFDANGWSENANGAAKDREEEYAGGLVRVVYAHDSADAYIERETRRLRSEGKAVCAATSDGGIATACRLHGATVFSAKYFVTELKASRNAGAAILADFNKRQERLSGGPRSSGIWDALDESLREQLDGQIQQSAEALLTRKQREALEAIERDKAEGRLVERGAMARRKQMLAEQAAAKRRRRAEAKAEAEAEAADGEVLDASEEDVDT